MPNVPSCEVCGQPCHNIDRDGDHTGRHRDVEECLRTMGRRIADLEKGAVGGIRQGEALLLGPRPEQS